MDRDLYAGLVAAYPDRDRFTSLAKVGDKLTLSERFNPRAYAEFIRSQPLWRDFHAWVKSDDFIAEVLGVLRDHHVDLGFDPHRRNGLGRRLLHALQGRLDPRDARLTARFEFSMLPALGGHVIPHTDGVSKIVTLVISMLKDGEWSPEWGGGTDVNQPRDDRLAYNQRNDQAGFEDMEVIDTYAFQPNQAVIFVKTFNSWHSVRPMTGPDADTLRRTLTINIETSA